MLNNRTFSIVLLLIGIHIGQGSTPLQGATFVAPPSDVDLIGTTRYVTAASGDSLIDIARQHGLGQEAVRRANAEKPLWLPVSGEQVVLPTRHVLPAAPRTGLVINLPERRLYDYSLSEVRRPAVPRIGIYPVSIGRIDWATPLGVSKIISRRENPVWTPPASIRAEAAARGRTLPESVGPGPENPLGQHALYLDLPGYLLHGTIDVDAIGIRVTHGCIRLYPDDIETLYRRLPDSTVVRFIDEPIKVGWSAGQLHLEVHPPLKEHAISDEAFLDQAIALIRHELSDRPTRRPDSIAIRKAVEQRSGLPVIVTKSRSVFSRPE